MSEYSLPIASLVSSADMHFLEELDNEQFWQYATQLADSSCAPVQPFEGFLTCALEQVHCNLSMKSLREILPAPTMNQISLLPASPTWMAGLIPWRCGIIAVVDFVSYLTQTQALLRSSDLLLIAQVGLQEDLFVGLLMPVVGDVKFFDADSPLQAAHTSTFSPLLNTAVQGVRGDSFVIDLSRVLVDIVQRIQMATSYA